MAEITRYHDRELLEENQRDKLTRLLNRETLDREITRLLMTQADMHRRLEHHVFPQVGHISASIGVVQIRGQEGTSDVIDQADKTLYCAKEHGRSQVCFFQAMMDIGLATDTAAENTGSVDFF